MNHIPNIDNNNIEEIIKELNKNIKIIIHYIDIIPKNIIKAYNNIKSKDIYTRTEAAEYLNIHKDTVYRLAVKGILPYSTVSEKKKSKMLFYKSDLDRHLNINRVESHQKYYERLDNYPLN